MTTLVTAGRSPEPAGPLRVLIVNSLYYPDLRGGAERSLQGLAEALVGLGVEVIIARTAPRGQGRREAVNGVEVVHLPISNLYWPFDGASHRPLARRVWHLADSFNPGMRTALRKLIRRERPTLVHTNNLQGLSVSAWRAAGAEGRPVIHTLRDYYLACGRCTRYRNGRNCEATCWECVPLAEVRRIASRSVTGVVGTSHHILETHRRLGFFPRAAHWSVIYNGVAPSELRARRVPPHCPMRFGYLGRLDVEKGIDYLVNAFASFRRDDWELWIGGKSSRARDASWPDPSRGRPIRFIGETTAAEFFRQIDVLVVSSLWHEPLPRVILEARAHGVPVIASRRGGCVEIVEDEKTGLLFEPGEPGALERAVSRLIDEPCRVEHMGRLAYERAAESTAEVMAQRYLEAYRALVSASPETPAFAAPPKPASSAGATRPST